MLRKIRVSGFRSFNNFEFSVQPGLNVLVGANGTGKTNLITLLEFLSYLARGSLPEAFSRIGGAGDAFRRQILPHSRQLMSISIEGYGWNTRSRRREPVREFIKYQYDAEIELSVEKSAVFFKTQRVRCSVGSEPEEITADKWDADIETFTDENGSVSSRIYRLRKEVVEDRILGSKESSTEITLKKFIAEDIESAKAIPLFEMYDRFIPSLTKIYYDLYAARSFNIDPRMAKQSEDVANEPGIRPDGKGLAATLYFLKTGGRERRALYSFPPMFLPESPSKTFSQIIDYCRLVNDSIIDIDVVGDSVENKLKIFIDTVYDQSHIRMPFAMASDGTAKWISLVTAILTSAGVFSIEEPENYLHPLMQKEIVNIVREAFERNEENFAVISTHSETLINCLRPKELIIFSIADGVTKANRPENIDDVVQEIAKTPFGLSYYYLAGALD